MRWLQHRLLLRDWGILRIAARDTIRGGIVTGHGLDTYCSALTPLWTAVPFGGQSTLILNDLSPKRDASPKRLQELRARGRADNTEVTIALGAIKGLWTRVERPSYPSTSLVIPLYFIIQQLTSYLLTKVRSSRKPGYVSRQW